MEVMDETVPVSSPATVDALVESASKSATTPQDWRALKRTDVGSEGRVAPFAHLAGALARGRACPRSRRLRTCLCGNENYGLHAVGFPTRGITPHYLGVRHWPSSPRDLGSVANEYGDVEFAAELAGVRDKGFGPY